MESRQLIDTLLSIRPGAHWVLTGNVYEGLVWLDAPETKPTREDLGL